MPMSQYWGYGDRWAPGALWLVALAHLVSYRPMRDPVSKNQSVIRREGPVGKSTCQLDDPSLIPGTHVVKGEKHLSDGVL